MCRISSLKNKKNNLLDTQMSKIRDWFQPMRNGSNWDSLCSSPQYQNRSYTSCDRLVLYLGRMQGPPRNSQ